MAPRKRSSRSPSTGAISPFQLMVTRAAGSPYFPRPFLSGCSFLKAMGHILHTRAGTGASEQHRGQAADLRCAPQLDLVRGHTARERFVENAFLTWAASAT